MEITKHAYKRAKERLSFNKSALINSLNKAIDMNIHHGKTKGNLHKWISAQILKHKIKLKVLCYSDFMLLHDGEAVVTIYKIPSNMTPIKKYIKA